MDWLKDKLFSSYYIDMTEEENEYVNRIKGQNPFGIMAMLFGGVAFAFGPMFKWIPLFTIVFCLITFGTFDRETEDNPWTFFIGFGLSVIGLSMYFYNLLHEDYLFY
ncbi:cell division protein FtsK [Bacillus sp. LL01]|uniref:cell division protein FtsK n=1 Tax=Bacillus sp. LL01 TaxID=1665556 RepID=UPI0018E314E2|nr:cell division protein FtsK [Bacillus sp. LL01]